MTAMNQRDTFKSNINMLQKSENLFSMPYMKPLQFLTGAGERTRKRAKLQVENCVKPSLA